MKNRLWIAAAVVFAAWIHIHLTEQAYWEGYEDAEMRLGTTAEQCFQWWFGNGIRHEQEMKKFCKRTQP
jgi:hypothetical protein